MWDYYNGKSILVTGGSGFLGTALVHRLLTSTSAARIYLVCRGGGTKLQARWTQWLPQAANICGDSRLVVFDGDILQPGLGLSKSDLDTVQNSISIIIHAASSINLIEGLDRLIGTVIEASQMMVDLAFTCPKFERFVYVSTAYANAHLFSESNHCDLRIDEEIYDVRGTGEASVLAELEEVRKSGTSKAYEAGNFPWAYAYAKNVTERLLQYRFSVLSLDEKLLIVRPSVIGPSQCLPFPGYIMPMSSPYIVTAALTCLFPFRELKVATSLEEPERDIYMDIVPVDVVVDRLLSHLAMDTCGCVHAVSGVKSRVSFKSGYTMLMKLRRIPWGIRLVWLNEDWKSEKQHWFPRLYGILGTSFSFSEEKTIVLSRLLPEKKMTGLQLFTKIEVSGAIMSWTESIRHVMDKFAAKSIFVWLIVWIFYFDFGKSRSCR